MSRERKKQELIYHVAREFDLTPATIRGIIEMWKA
jgi:hypothetical protein